jgi:glycosyltransferase involved in cell wall biosynthesis
MITYNHERFVAQAIESVLAQRVDFPIEIVIGEDCSTDNTRQILRSFSAKHPSLFRLLLPSENIGMNPNLATTIKACKGQYIALLEGDDFWTDPTKLQRQVDFLDAHEQCSTCFHRVAIVDEDGRETGVSGDNLNIQAVYSVADLIGRRFFAKTASVMFRRGLFENFPDWYFRCPVGDFPIHVMNGMHGQFGFLDQQMAAYRMHAGGVWSALGMHSEALQNRRKLRQYECTAQLYEILSENVGPAWTAELNNGIAFYRYHAAHLLRRIEDWESLRKMAWMILKKRPISPDVPLVRVFGLLVQAYFPWTARLADRLRALAARS